MSTNLQQPDGVQLLHSPDAATGVPYETYVAYTKRLLAALDALPTGAPTHALPHRSAFLDRPDD